MSTLISLVQLTNNLKHIFMKRLLVPSRHILYSKEQYAHLAEHLKEHAYDRIIFVITSSNLAHCKYSSLSLPDRVMMVNQLIFKLKQIASFSYSIICVPHYHETEHFIDRLMKSVQLQLDESVDKPSTDVFCFGSFIGKLFLDAGYTTYIKTGMDHIVLFKELFENNNEPFFYESLSDASKEVFENQRNILPHAKKIWLDTILQDMGSITSTRNYATYASQMSNQDMITVKYNDIKPYIIAGQISDEGCADATLFIPLAADFQDSDLIGVDISNEFIARAEENIRQAVFGNTFVSIVQANLMEKIFDDESITTTICNSTMHEVWSYNTKRSSVDTYLQLKRAQLVLGGRVVIRDVIGPQDKDIIVLLRSYKDDYVHLKRFLKDFKHLREQDTVEEIIHDGVTYYKMTMKLAGEYLLHKDYHDNWDSEVQEEFCHFDVDDWKEVLLSNNFKIVTIESYRSEWILKNRYEGEVGLFNENMEPISFPDTNVIVVAEK